MRFIDKSPLVPGRYYSQRTSDNRNWTCPQLGQELQFLQDEALRALPARTRNQRAQADTLIPPEMEADCYWTEATIVGRPVETWRDRLPNESVQYRLPQTPHEAARQAATLRYKPN